MSMKKGPLGRGLSALISDNSYEKKFVEEVVSAGSIALIDIELVDLNPFQPRTQFDEEALKELAESIRQLGVIQPITVRKMENDRYQLISGERRLRATKLTGLTQIPSFDREAIDQTMLEMALVENIQREDLNSIEIAITYQRLIEECKLTQEALADRVGKKRSTVTNYLRLLKLPAEVQAGIRDKLVTMGHARAMINVESMDDMLRIYHRCIDEGLSVRAIENLVKALHEPKPVLLEMAEMGNQPEIKTNEPVQVIEANTQKLEEKQELAFPDGIPADFNEEEYYKVPEKVELPEPFVRVRETLSTRFQTQVDVRRETNGKGRIIINFKSDEDFDRILQFLENQKLAEQEVNEHYSN